MCKPSFISTLRPTVRAYISRKRTFSKTLFNRKILKTLDFCSSVDGNHFKKEAFRKWWRLGDHVTSRAAQIQKNWTGVITCLNLSCNWAQAPTEETCRKNQFCQSVQRGTQRWRLLTNLYSISLSNAGMKNRGELTTWQQKPSCRKGM